MSYYLSYIEIYGHSAFVLSEQSNHSESAKIICEVGFGFAPNIKKTEYFTTYKGYVHEERLASQVMYSSRAKAVHRTYEISRTEMEKFFSIINRDQAINASPMMVLPQEGGGLQERYVGGPDYQKITFNCKTYAIGVLKEMSIIDAANLSNFLVQRPGTTGLLLQPLSRKELSCPLYEELLTEITSVLTHLSSVMVSFQTSVDDDEEIDDEVKKQLIKDIQSTLTMSASLLEDKEKEGIKEILAKRLSFSRLSTVLDFMYELKTFNEKDSLKQDLLAILDLADKINQLSMQNELDFYWKTTPSVATRLNLNNFNEQEKAIYLTKIKTNETFDGLNQILIELEKQISIAKTSAPKLYEDLINLQKIIQNTKEKVDKNRDEFLNSIPQTKSEDIISECAKQQQVLGNLINTMEQALSGLKLGQSG